MNEIIAVNDGDPLAFRHVKCSIACSGGTTILIASEQANPGIVNHELSHDSDAVIARRIIGHYELEVAQRLSLN
jgi:hypothetical protein